MKTSKLLLSMLLALSLTACSNNTSNTTETASDETTSETADESESTADAEALSLTGTYSFNISGYDWGPAVDKAIVTLSAPIDSVDKDTFTVKETKMAADWEAEDTPVIEQTFDREVTEAYLCDEEGNKVDEPSKNVMLELKVDPNTGNPLTYDPATYYNSWSDPYQLEIEVAEGKELESEGEKVEELKIDVEYTSKTSASDVYKTDSYKTESGVEYDYAYFTPEQESKNLVVWLHGMGEGGSGVIDGTDPLVTVLANKATALTQEEFQDTVGGANILVPQSATYWMDNIGDGSGAETRIEDTVNSSYYTESLHELINHYKEEIGAEKVIIAGASNGGFMTILLAENYGNEYQGYVAIAESLPDDQITDEDINKLKEVPLFMIYSKDDSTIDPTTHEEPTIKRLQEAGAKNLEVVTFDHVTDTTGEYKDEEGEPYQYAGHWSWIYFYNNEAVTDDGQTVFEWIADCIKGELEQSE